MRRGAAIGGLVLALLWGCGGSDGDAPPPGPAVTYNLQVISDDPRQDTNPLLDANATVIVQGNNGPVGLKSFRYHAYFPSNRTEELRVLVLHIPPEASFESGKVFPANTEDPWVKASNYFVAAPYEPPVDAIAFWGTSGVGSEGTVTCVSRNGRECTYAIDLLLRPGAGADLETILRGTLTVDYAQIEAE